MLTPKSGDGAIEIEKLARLISDELDASLVENGLIPAGECLPFDMLSPPARLAIKQAAERVYKQMVYDAASGTLRVIRTGSNASGS